MSISLVRYVDITSTVIAGAVVPIRQLILNLFTTNILLPPQNLITFETAAEVGEYFGTNSEEYLRASSNYFNFISKGAVATQPPAIMFSRWVETAVAPMIFGLNADTTVADWVAITSGSIGLTLGVNTFNLTGLNFSSAVSLANVATILQTAIQAETGGGTMWTAATVTYNSSTGNFDLVGGETIAFASGAVAVQVGTGGTDISGLIGWLPQAQTINGVYIPGAIWAYGSLVETITQTLTNNYEATNNFGTFGFLYTGINSGVGLTLSQYTQAANWNFSTTPNVQFELTIPVLPSNTSTWYAALSGIGGCSMTLSPITASPPSTAPTQYPEQCTAAIKAATNYNAANTVQNYMFNNFPNLTPSVSTDAQANAMDALSINYIGVTQNAGQLFAFYQRGLMQGPSTSPLLQNVYANEQWFKSALQTAIMTLLTQVNEVPANNQGQGMILNILLGVINQAILNGTIEVGKTLTDQEIADIGTLTGNTNAWMQVQNAGYWLSVVIKQIPDITPTQYEAVYVLVYSKNDVINFVSGSNNLI